MGLITAGQAAAGATGTAGFDIPAQAPTGRGIGHGTQADDSGAP